MNKQLTLTFKDKTYTIEFTRSSIRQMERGGFDPEKLVSMPMTMLPDLFAGGFIANHPSMKRSKVDEIYKELKDKKKLLNALLEMYAEPVNSLMDEGNLDWTPNWQMDEEEEEKEEEVSD